MIEMFRTVSEFLADNALPLLMLLLGMLSMGCFWAARHPEDIFKVDEIEIDTDDER